MEGMLSQDEINALLNGMDLSGDDPPDLSGLDLGTPASDEPPKEDFLTGSSAASADGFELTDVEKDAIGEVANISMGSSATTLYSLVNRKVNITTPVVTLATWDELLGNYEKPCVFIQIKYTKGLDGTNILVLKESDVKVITDLMMGGDGTNIDGELSEIHLSAISEAMNQMMGTAATSLSSLLNIPTDISTPEVNTIDVESVKIFEKIFEGKKDNFVKVAFRITVGDLIDSTMVQLYPIDFAIEMIEEFQKVEERERNK